jgi:C1A family cysteine protease
MKVALVLFGLICASLAFEAEVLFTAWKAQYNKVYSSPEEEALRFANFKLSIDRVESRNAKSSNAVYGLTKFSDLTPEEFKATYLGSVIPENYDSYDVGVLEGGNIVAPNTWDWRTQNKVTPVKNQQQCGSCWAFSTVENIESIYCVSKNMDCNTLAPLSVQEIVDCDTTDQGCNGGWPYDAYQFVISEGGLEDDSDYPYTAQDGTCNFQQNLVKVQISSWKYATQNSDEATLQTNLVNWGPLSVCVDASSWQDYTGGVVMGSDCTNNIDHCVQLVGYDMTQSPSFWIVRNSWGTDWGENGYIRLQYGQDTCAVADVATSSVI